VDTFKKGLNLLKVRSESMGKCRKALWEAGFTLSANVTTNLKIGDIDPLEVALSKGAAKI
jgi:hypothetical protein